jgi:hypothetical protein
MMRCLPRAWKQRARASPIPDVPPMRRMVENEDVILREGYWVRWLGWGCLNILIDRKKGREDYIFILGHNVDRRYAITYVGTSGMIKEWYLHDKVTKFGKLRG